MRILIQPVTQGEYKLNEFAVEIAARAESCWLKINYQWITRCYERFKPTFVTFALFVKHVLLGFLNNGRTEYTFEQTVSLANKIATLSGRGRFSDYDQGDLYSCALCTWSWAFVKGFALAAESSEDIKMARNLWSIYSDGSAHLDFHDREFAIETPDIHESWAPQDYGVLEKWYALEDKSYHYFLYKVFPSEYQARLFIAELVMKINSPWYAPLAKATHDITDRMAEVFTHTHDIVDKELDRLKKSTSQASGGTVDTQRVYVMNFKDGINKIGVSRNIETRVRTKEKESGRVAREVCATDLIPSTEAYRIEHLCHVDLKDYRIAGSEFFQCSYELAKATVQKYSPITVRLEF